MDNKNYSILKMLILDEILAGRSTLEMSKLLGFQFDKYKRWLKNDKILRFDEFQQLCSVVGLNLVSAMSTIYSTRANPETFDSLFSHMKEFNTFTTNQDIADYLKCHVSVIKRYNKGDTIPDIETIFKLIDYKANLLSMFLNNLFSSPVKNPLLKKWIDDGLHPARFECSLPISSIIEASLRLEAYGQRDIPTVDWLHDLLGLGREDIQHALKEMQSSHILVKQGDDFLPNNGTVNLDGLSFHEVAPISLFLNQRMIELLEKKVKKSQSQDQTSITKSPTHPGVVTFRVFAASKDSMMSINDLIMKTNNEILKILLNDEQPRTETRAFLLQHFSLQA